MPVEIAFQAVQPNAVLCPEPSNVTLLNALVPTAVLKSEVAFAANEPEPTATFNLPDVRAVRD